MDRTQIMIGRVMLIGILLSVACVLAGGLWDMIYYGNTPIDYQTFHGVSPHLLTFNTARGLIKIGVLLLVLTQVLRVALVSWYFFTLHDYFFVTVGVLIVLVIIMSLVFRA